MAKEKHKKKSNPGQSKKKNKQSINELVSKISNWKYLSITISTFYFIVLTIVSLTYHKVGDYGVETDFFWGYVPAAKEFLNGVVVIDPFRGPLYPIVLAIFNFIFNEFFTSGVILGILSASIVIYFSFELIKRIFSGEIAMAVILLLICNPIFLQYSYSAGTDMFFNALVTATLFFFFKDEKLNYKNLVLAGVIGGLSYLTRYNGIFLLSFVLIILFVNYWNLNWFNRAKASILFAAIFLLTISPWGIYCLSEKGSFFYNENYKNVAYEIHGKGKISWDDFWFNESSKVTSLNDLVFKDPGLFIRKLAGNTFENFLSDMNSLLGWQIGVFVILGLIILFASNPFKNWKGRETSYYITNIIFFGLLLLIFYSERFSLFLIPFYLVLALQPFFNSKFKLKKFVPVKFAYLLIAGLFVFTFVQSYSFNQTRISSGPNELLILRDWYNNNVPENQKGKIIAARKAHVAYYLDMKFKLMPMANSYEELITKLKEQNADYLYFSMIEASMRPQFQNLLNPNSAHPGLTTVVFFNNPPSVLYRVK